MTKLLTVKRSMFFVAFLALALVGMAILQGTPTVNGMNQESDVTNSDDLAYAESTTTITASSGTINGSQVTFGLAGAKSSLDTAANGAAAERGTDYQKYASSITDDLSSKAASGSAITIDTSGYSLPLRSDTYLPAQISCTYNGADFAADTSWSGTVLARAGFNTDNPDIAISSGSVSLGYVETPTKDEAKSYNVSAKKWSAGETSFSRGTVTNWKSSVPGTENLAEVGITIDTSAVEYDAASGTLSVKQQIHLKKVASR